MLPIIYLTNSNLKSKKYDAVFPTGTKISFGAKGYSDFTINKDDQRKMNYIKRHKINENWNDIEKAGTWSRFILWNKPSLNQSIRDMERIFNVQIINMTN